jgi:hypothetical protein
VNNFYEKAIYKTENNFVLANRPTSPIAVCHVKSIQTVSGVKVTFEISNRTGSPYALQPLEVEAREGGEWRRCFFFVEQLSSPSVIYPWRDVVAPHRSASRVFELTNLPPQVPLRLRCFIIRELTGIPGFWERFQERYHHVGGLVSLNPFDKYTTVFDQNVYQITSEEFVEPELK